VVGEGFFGSVTLLRAGLGVQKLCPSGEKNNQKNKILQETKIKRPQKLGGKQSLLV
jgi:hypothetical protein